MKIFGLGFGVSSWSVKRGVDWHDCVVLAVSDAGHANASEYLSEWDQVEPFRSQGGKLVFLAQPSAVKDETFQVVLISFSSNALKRVVRSTIQAEAYNLQLTIEEADLPCGRDRRTGAAGSS